MKAEPGQTARSDKRRKLELDPSWRSTGCEFGFRDWLLLFGDNKVIANA